MSKTSIDIDNDKYERVARLLGTSTKRETVDAAFDALLEQQRRIKASERFISSLEAGDYDDLLDDEVMNRAWR